MCGVCNKHRTLETLPGGAIYQDDLIFVAHFPVSPTEPAHYGHVILEFKRHITKPSELINEEAKAFGLWTQKISSLLEEKLNAEHVYITRIGDLTPHLHFHFVPRYKETPKEFWGPLLFRWKDGRKASPDDMVAITNLLKFNA